MICQYIAAADFYLFQQFNRVDWIMIIPHFMSLFSHLHFLCSVFIFLTRPSHDLFHILDL